MASVTADAAQGPLAEIESERESAELWAFAVEPLHGSDDDTTELEATLDASDKDSASTDEPPPDLEADDEATQGDEHPGDSPAPAKPVRLPPVASHWHPRAHDGPLRSRELYRSSHWAVPWSDLMMVMFVMFAMLVTMQMRENRRLIESAERQQEAAAREEQDQRMPSAERERIETETVPFPSLEPLMPYPSFEPLLRIDVLERSRDAVRDAKVDNVEIALMNDDSVKVSVQGPMFFELGQADLRSEVRSFLDRLARVIAQTPYRVDVIGHTDDYAVDTAEFPSNWELSAARAARVARYLIDSAEIDPRRFTVMGRGEFEPAVANTSDANRSLNRRVEIIITRNELEPTELSQ